ncbi:MAG TPA: hypothetical protein VFK66_07645 [Oryzihumus sp.]|nr:hypothetical protein [Oryzihumus sp.]
MTQTPSLESLVRTRESLHQVAEHVLAAARKRQTGHFTLRASPGGFCTPPLDDGRVIAVDHTDITVTDAAGAHRAPLTTVRAAADLVGITAGFPTTHGWATPLEPDATLTVDPAAADTLAAWFALGQRALEVLVAELADEHPSDPSLFPEHFDLGVTIAEVNYGVSPGDGRIAEPYVYVGPFAGPPTQDEYWNAPFGATLPRARVATSDDALAFFREGHRRLRTRA